MVEMPDGFVVRKGSQANLSPVESFAPTWENVRQKLIDAQVLRPVKQHLEFFEDATFSSPSAAASVVLGRQAAGPIFWVNEKDNRTYKQVQEDQAGATSRSSR